MIVERRSSPEWLDRAGELFLVEGGENAFTSREMQDRFQVPGDALREALGQMGEPETGVAVPRAVSNREHSPGLEPRGEALEQARLLGRR